MRFPSFLVLTLGNWYIRLYLSVRARLPACLRCNLFLILCIPSRIWLLNCHLRRSTRVWECCACVRNWWSSSRLDCRPWVACHGPWGPVCSRNRGTRSFLRFLRLNCRRFDRWELGHRWRCRLSRGIPKLLKGHRCWTFGHLLSRFSCHRWSCKHRLLWSLKSLNSGNFSLFNSIAARFLLE